MKPDGKVRICGDYKVTINRAAKVERYPIPRIELFASLSAGQRFTKLDLLHAYLQIPLDTPSRRLVTINTHKGLFEYTCLPFGIASAPSIFQQTILRAFTGMCKPQRYPGYRNDRAGAPDQSRASPSTTRISGNETKTTQVCVPIRVSLVSGTCDKQGMTTHS